MIEVYTEANEPWTTGQRQAYALAVLKFAENPQLDYANDPAFDADAVLSDAPGYVGWGANAHENAEGPVFNDADAASRFMAYVREETGHLNMSTRQWSL